MMEKRTISLYIHRFGATRTPKFHLGQREIRHRSPRGPREKFANRRGKFRGAKYPELPRGGRETEFQDKMSARGMG